MGAIFVFVAGLEGGEGGFEFGEEGLRGCVGGEGLGEELFVCAGVGCELGFDGFVGGG